MNFEVGQTVKWVDSHYIILEIKGNKATLKQKFSIGTVLNGQIPLSELSI